MCSKDIETLLLNNILIISYLQEVLFDEAQKKEYIMYKKDTLEKLLEMTIGTVLPNTWGNKIYSIEDLNNAKQEYYNLIEQLT